MMNLIETRIAQVKTLHDLCAERGVNPPFTLEQFDAMVAELRQKENPETDLNRVVLFHHKLLHELLYAPPSRG